MIGLGKDLAKALAYFLVSLFLKTYIYNFGIYRGTNFILGKHVP